MDFSKEGELSEEDLEILVNVDEEFYRYHCQMFILLGRETLKGFFQIKTTGWSSADSLKLRGITTIWWETGSFLIIISLTSTTLRYITPLFKNITQPKFKTQNPTYPPFNLGCNFNSIIYSFSFYKKLSFYL